MKGPATHYVYDNDPGSPQGVHVDITGKTAAHLVQLRVGGQDGVLLFAGVLRLLVVELVAAHAGVGKHHPYGITGV